MKEVCRGHQEEEWHRIGVTTNQEKRRKASQEADSNFESNLASPCGAGGGWHSGGGQTSCDGARSVGWSVWWEQRTRVSHLQDSHVHGGGGLLNAVRALRGVWLERQRRVTCMLGSNFCANLGTG